MYRPTARGALACLLVLPLAVCGDSSTEPEDELTDQEFDAFLEVLVVLSEVDLSGIGGTAAAAPSAVPQTFPVDEAFPCPEGGTVRVAGSVTADDETGEVDLNVTETHQDCRAVAPSSGMLFELDGAPNVTVVAALEVGETSLTFSATQQGAIRWATGGRTGVCSIDLDVQLVFADEFDTDPTVSVEGSLCGRAVDQIMP